MTYRAAIILIQDERIALIERHRAGDHYFAFPGGHIEPGETPEQAAGREAWEELGLQVETVRQVAEGSWQGHPQYYFLVRVIGGTFGTGMGDEMQSPPAGRGTYHPIWMPLDDILNQPVKPQKIAEFVSRSYKNGWPDKPVMIAS